MQIVLPIAASIPPYVTFPDAHGAADRRLVALGPVGAGRGRKMVLCLGPCAPN
jgi:hypothetical protein